MSTEPDQLLFNPFEPGFFDDPYSAYAPLRDGAPVTETPFGPWMLFRYDDSHRLLRDPTTSVDDSNATWNMREALFEQVAGEEWAERGNRSILNVDPPDHTRLRKLVSKAFTPRMVENLRPRVQQLVDDVLDRIAAAGPGEPVDLIAELAFPLPFTVISEMLGMPEADRDRLRGWSHAMAKTLDPILTPDDVAAAVDANRHMLEHIDEAAAWKREHPGDDLLTGLLHAEDDGDRLDHHELVDQVILLFIAGHETTVNLIGNGILALLRNRAQLERLQDDPSLDANATDELLRYDSPVQFSRRITTTDVDVHGTTIPQGSIALTCLGSANHDPARWGPDADELRLEREGAAQHLSFGSGVHHCLGANLARVEGQVAIGSLVRRFPDLEAVDETADWNGRIVLRGLDSLRVSLA